MSRQSYYRAGWRARDHRQTAQQAVKLVSEVRRLLPRVGTRKLHYMLNGPLKQLGIGRDKLFAILDANQMCIRPLRSYKVTTNSKHLFRKHSNLIADVVPERPEQIWVSDITYLAAHRRHYYLSLVTDAYSKMIVGYHLSENLDAAGCVNALKMAVKSRKYPKQQLIHHSDRGIQYCCRQYQDVMTRYGIKCSMTQNHDPYANAIAERINGILKQEFLLERQNADLTTMKQLVTECIHLYNRFRPHSSCQMLTPEQMHHQNEIQVRTYKKLSASKPLTDN